MKIREYARYATGSIYPKMKIDDIKQADLSCFAHVWYRVIGRFPDRESAEELTRRLDAQKKGENFVVLVLETPHDEIREVHRWQILEVIEIDHGPPQPTESQPANVTERTPRNRSASPTRPDSSACRKF